MDSLASLDGQKSMSFLTEINRIYWCVIWTRCSGRLLGNCAVQKTLTEISTVSILTMVTLWIKIVLLLSLHWLCQCPCVHFLPASSEMIVSLLCDKTRHRRSFCCESHVLLIPHFLSLLLHSLMMHRLTLQLLPSPLPFCISIYAKEPSVQSPCSRLFPQMPPSLWEYQINEIDLSFLVIYQLLCLFHACPACIQECPATVDQWCNIHFYTTGITNK